MADCVHLESMFPLLLDIAGRGDISVNIRRPGTFSISGAGARRASDIGSGTLRSVLPSRPETRRPGAGTVHAFGDIWYENVILFPTQVEVGTISAPYVFPLVIWNSHRTRQTLQLRRVGWDGISEDIPGTLTLGPLCWREYEVAVTMSGPAIIEAALEVRSSGGTSLLSVTGMRGVVWPFRPQRGMQETWEWKTEVQEAWDRTETRLALRDVPRISLRCTYLLEQERAAQLDMLLYEMPGMVFALPAWERQTAVSDVQAGAESISCDLNTTPWQAGDSLIIWQDERRNELARVAAVGNSALALEAPVSRTYRNALVMPCMQAHVDGAAGRDMSVPVAEYDVELRLEDAMPAWSVADDSAVEQYEGHDVWEFPLYLSDGDTLARNLSFPRITLDNGLGPVRVLHAAPTPAASFTVTLPAHGREEAMRLRGRLLRRQGCLRPFWLSSRRQDIFPAAVLPAGSDQLSVRGFGTGVGFAADSRRRVLRLEYLDGMVLYRTVLAMSRESDAIDIMRLSAPLSETEDIQPSAFRRISWMSLHRLASDAVCWTWTRAEWGEARFSVQEVRA